MAKKKKKAHKHHRVGALSFHPNSPLVKWGSVLLGFLAAKPINTAIDGIVPSSLTTNKNYQKIAGVGQAGLGTLLVFKKGKKSLITSLLGGVALGSGAKRALDAFTGSTTGGYGNVEVLNGYGRVQVLNGRKTLRGYTPNSSLNGYTTNSSLNGSIKPHQQVMGGMGNATGSGINSNSSFMDN